MPKKRASQPTESEDRYQWMRMLPLQTPLRPTVLASLANMTVY